MAKKAGTTDAPAEQEQAGQVATTNADQPATNDAGSESGGAATEEIEVTISPEGMDTTSLFTSFVEAQDKFTTPKRSKTAKVVDANGKLLYEYDYADLEDIIRAIRPALRAAKLGFYQLVTNDLAKVTVRTVLVHGPTGAKLESEPISIMGQSPKAQHIGGAITYARRYSLASFMGVAAEDDNDEAEAVGSGRRQVVVPDDEHIPANRSSAAPRNTAARAPAAAQGAAAAPYKGEAGTAPSSAGKGAQTGAKKDDRQKIGKGDAAHYEGCVTVGQIKRMFGIAGEHSVTAEAIRSFLADGKIMASEDIPVDRYEGIIAAIQAGHVGG